MAIAESQLLQKLPPHNIEAEQSLLGALLIDKESMLKIGDKIDARDFYKSIHGMIWSSMLELFHKHEPIDILTLSNRLGEKEQLEAIGGRTYLMSLANLVPTSAHITQYADIVQKNSVLRRLIETAGQITELGYAQSEELDKILDAVQQKVFAVSQRYLKGSFVPIQEVLDKAFERIDEIHKEKGKLRGVPTGFYELDNLLAGLQKSDLVILAARPSVGKTSLALDIARHVATRMKQTVGIFSLEMSKDQLVDRLICSEAGVDMWKMRTGRLKTTDGDDDFTKIGNAIGVLSEAPIYIDDSSTSSVLEIRTKARRLQMEHGNLGLIVVDYLQLMDSKSKGMDSRVLEISDITRSLKSIARELNIPVLALSQLSRAVEARKPAIPKLSDLRESGSIEQDADVVMFIYRKSRDDNYHKEEIRPEERGLVELYVSKHRNGPIGMVPLFFDENHVSFRSLSKNQPPNHL